MTKIIEKIGLTLFHGSSNNIDVGKCNLLFFEVESHAINDVKVKSKNNESVQIVKDDFFFNKVCIVDEDLIGLSKKNESELKKLAGLGFDAITNESRSAFLVFDMEKARVDTRFLIESRRLLSHKDLNEVEMFDKWLKEHKLSIESTCGEWEVTRYRKFDDLRIIYTNKRGCLSYSNSGAMRDWLDFKISNLL